MTSNNHATQINKPSNGWINVSVMGWAHLASDFYCDILPILLPVLALRFGFSYSECGALFMAFQILANFIQPVIGLAAVRYNLNWTMPLSILFGGIFICLVTLASSTWILIATIILSGMCASTFHPVAGGIMPKVTPKHRDVLATSIFIAGGNIGFAFAPLVVALFLEHFTDDKLFYLSFPAILTACVIYMRKLHTKENNLSSSHIKNVDIKALMKNGPFVWFTVSFALRSLCYCALLIYLPLLFKNHGFDTMQSAGAVTTMLIGTAAGGLAIGGLSTRFGLKFLILSTYATCFAGIAVFLWQPDLNLITYLALFVVGASVYGSTPVAIVWAERILSRSAAAFATSMMVGFTFGVGYILSVLTGFIADYFGLSFALGITLLPALVIASFILFLLKEPEDTETQED